MESDGIILIGGGGHCKSVIDAAESAMQKIIGILDIAENVGKTVLGYPIMGTDDDIPQWVGKATFVVTVGQIQSAELRIKLTEKVKMLNGRLGTIIAADAHVSKHAKVGAGTAILHKAVVNAGAIIGEGCIINTMANIEHDAHIGDFCHISTGAMVNGDCTVGSKTFVGSGTTIANGVSVAENSIVAVGSVVRKNALQSGIYSGNPAILMKRRNG